MILAYCDGSITGGHWGKKGSTEPARCWSGWVVKTSEGEVIHHHSLALGEVPNASANVSEYMAVRSVLVWLAKNGYSQSSIRVHSDSQLIVNQLTGKFQVHDERMGRLRDHVREVAKLFPLVHYVWIPREDNRYADFMSKALHGNGGIPAVPIPDEVLARHR